MTASRWLIPSPRRAAFRLPKVAGAADLMGIQYSLCHSTVDDSFAPTSVRAGVLAPRRSVRRPAHVGRAPASSPSALGS